MEAFEADGLTLALARLDGELLEQEAAERRGRADDLAGGRGVVNGLLFSIPMWGLIGAFAWYLL